MQQLQRAALYNFIHITCREHYTTEYSSNELAYITFFKKFLVPHDSFVFHFSSHPHRPAMMAQPRRPAAASLAPTRRSGGLARSDPAASPAVVSQRWPHSSHVSSRCSSPASPSRPRGSDQAPCHASPAEASELQPRPHRSASPHPHRPPFLVLSEWKRSGWGPLAWNDVLARAATSSDEFSLFSFFDFEKLTWLCYRELITARCGRPNLRSHDHRFKALETVFQGVPDWPTPELASGDR